MVESTHPWEIAQVNTGRDTQVTMTDYRNSERILYDSEELAQWVTDKVRPHWGKEVEEWVVGEWQKGGEVKVKKRFKRLNERLRFLKYGPGMFFKRE